MLSSEAVQVERSGDVIEFYNIVFIPSVKSFLLHLSQRRIPIVPPPKLPQPGGASPFSFPAACSCSLPALGRLLFSSDVLQACLIPAFHFLQPICSCLLAPVISAARSCLSLCNIAMDQCTRAQHDEQSSLHLTRFHRLPPDIRPCSRRLEASRMLFCLAAPVVVSPKAGLPCQTPPAFDRSIKLLAEMGSPPHPLQSPGRIIVSPMQKTPDQVNPPQVPLLPRALVDEFL